MNLLLSSTRLELTALLRIKPDEQYSVGSVLYLYKLFNYDKLGFKRFLIDLKNNGIMEMVHPPACFFASVQDGKQEIYLEWPYHANYLINVLRVNKKLNLSYFGAPTTGPIRHNLSPHGSRDRAR